jgi:superfamily II DNA or RNA helicase
VTDQGGLWTPAGLPRPVLRPYQVAAVEQVFAAWQAGRHAPLLMLPTGAGKTVIVVEIIRLVVEVVAAAACVLVLVPRRELVGQTVEKLAAVGIAPGVICAAMDPEAGLQAPVQVASVDTLHARVQRLDRLTLPVPELVVVDEAHLSITKRKVELVEALGAKRLLGLTATPTRKDGRALAVLYDELLAPATVAELTTAGHLVRARYWSWPTPDLGGVRIDSKTKDYRLDDLAVVVNRPKLLADVVTTWLKHAGDRRTVVFTVDIKHAVAMAEAFRREGVAAEHLSAETPLPEREAILTRFRAGDVQVVSNCFVLAYGFDLPAVSAVVLARPTRSLMLYLQMVGRALRPAPGKLDCLVLDHAGAVHRHGFIDEERTWTLDGRTALVASAGHVRAPRDAKECPECAAVWLDGPTCPECGYTLRPRGRLVPTLDGELVELAAAAAAREAEDRRRVHAEFLGFARERGYRPGFAYFKYLERYAEEPPRAWRYDPPQPPSGATRGWIRSRWIAQRKARESAATTAALDHPPGAEVD